MRVTAPRLVRLLPRAKLNVSDAKIIGRPIPQTQDRLRPTTIDLLLKQKETAGENWPANLRLEPQLKKAVFKNVQPELRSAMKKLTKER
ncbi:hypothetical protein CVT24_001513 [Panaeolus cyanescens]|uniref:Uncharacterized protein n=1 Tax=Panaeolus cyanescens TaxID=181874 RepID=A0A409YFC6_9AGAR|nr:hypothetical protein CVT24_001513 [Panaeolus cyanescens]